MLDSSPPTVPSSTQPTGRTSTKWIVTLLLIAVVSTAWFSYRNEFTVERLAEREVALRQVLQEHPVATIVTAVALYVVVTALALPFATVLSLIYGWLFGFAVGVVMVSFSSTAGASGSFLLSRYLLRDWVERRFGERLVTFQQALEKEGAFYLFTLRLVPYVPFFVINIVMGLTKMRVRTFWWVSQLGMLPGTLVYLFAGSSLVSLADISRGNILTPRLIAAFVLLGCFPWIAKKTLARFAKRNGEAS